MEINLKVNKVYIPYLQKPQFTQIYYGGSSSGKSFFLCQKIIIDNMNGCNWLICRAVGKSIKRSVFNEIYKSINYMELSNLYSFNFSDMVITNKVNQAQIVFAGLDDVEKLKSITPRKGVIERIFIEEATEVKRNDYLQLKKRLRGPSKISKCIVMAFNPIFKLHWIYNDFFDGKVNDDIRKYEDDKVSILKTTYKDNIFLTEQDIENLEDESDPYFHNVYTLGNWGVLKGLVYKKFIEKFFDVHEISKRPGVMSVFGLDFGYTNDPSALFCGLVDEKNKEIYVFDELYERGLTNMELAPKVISMGYAKEKIMADSAVPQSIEELRQLGLSRIEGAYKNEVMYGIQKLMNFTFIIHPKCKNFINEINNYSYAEKDGESINKPIDKFNHLMDAMRYAVIPKLEGDVYSFK
jgi:phage terminase large subunit|nr:MAG TPA: terminase large subunit [Caudoviricetes sp.]